jgi:hypothetical protein
VCKKEQHTISGFYLHLDLGLDGLGLNSSRSSFAGAEPLAGLGREADRADVAPVIRVLAKLSPLGDQEKTLTSRASR